jgi:hypothetical protein
MTTRTDQPFSYRLLPALGFTNMFHQLIAGSTGDTVATGDFNAFSDTYFVTIAQ